MSLLDVEDLVSRLHLEEKISLLSGKDFWHTCDIPRLSIPSLRLSDGPNGARGTRFFNGPAAACLPCGTALAATWDTALLRVAGHLMGSEAIQKGAHVLLGPTINMQRSPLGGRGFESFSEDPYLAGMAAAAVIAGVQSTGVAAAVKHFVCNDQEHERQAVDVQLTERALREIYLMPFQLAQRDAKPLCFMTSYNKVNGTHVSEHPRLLDGLLRKEWGFDGLIMSDWFGTYSAAESCNAGLDLEMPGPPKMRGSNVMVSVGNRKLSEHVIDERVRNVLRLINSVSTLEIPKNAPEKEVDTAETAKTLRALASSSVVLMKNKGSILPLDRTKTVAVIGPNAAVAAYAGGGSASLKPYYARTPLEGILKFCPSARYTIGASVYKQLPLITHLSRTADGRPGLLAKFYNEPPDASIRICRDEIYVEQSEMPLMDYAHPDIEPFLFYVDLEGTFTPDDSGEYIFGCSVRGTAKFYIDGELVVDNETVQRMGSTFLGSGTQEERALRDLVANKTYNLLLQFGSSATQKVKKKGATGMRGGGIRLGAALKTDPNDEIAKAVALAKKVDQVVICAGLTGEYESEGFDRPDLALPYPTDKLIRAVCAVNDRTVVVIQSGTPVSMPWAPKVHALVHAWYGGNETGTAIADVLFGDTNPSGKLPLSFPECIEDTPAFLNWGSEKGRCLYGEDVYMGYRFYEHAKRDVLFPFGHGLSYTTFEMRHLTVECDAKTLHVSVNVVNTGNRDGAQVVQVYVRQLKPSVTRPPKELKGFSKVFLKAEQREDVTLSMELKYATSFWDEERRAWASEAGKYDVLIGDSSADIVLEGRFTLEKSTWWKGL